MPVVETTNTFLVEEVIKTKITQKLPEHKCVQVPSTEQLLEDGSVGKAQYSMQLPFPKCCLCKGLTLQSFRYCWIKKIESILRTSDLWQKLRCGIGKSFWVHQKMCGSRKYSYSPPPPHRRDGKFLWWRGGFPKVKTFRKCMKRTCNWNFQGHGGEGES